MTVTNRPSDKQLLLSHSNGELDVPFGRAEYARRVDRVRDGMRHAGVDVLFVSDPDDLSYLTGYNSLWYQANGHSGWGPSSGLAISAHEGRPVYFETEKERLLVGHTTVGIEFSLLPRYEKPLIESVRDGLEQRGWLTGTVGIQKSSYRPFPSISRKFEQLLVDRAATVVDATQVVRVARRTKSSAELNSIRRAAAIADAALRAGLEAARPGASELHIYGQMYRAMTRNGGEVPAMPPQVLGGTRTLHARGLPNRRALALGDVVVLSAFGCVDRYHALVTRTAFVGTPRDQVSQRCETLGNGIESVIGQLAAGDSPASLARLCASSLPDADGWPTSWESFGHDVGVAVPPDVMSERFFALSDETLDDSPWATGDTIALSFGFVLADGEGAFRNADTFVVGSNGVEALSTLPRKLFALE